MVISVPDFTPEIRDLSFEDLNEQLLFSVGEAKGLAACADGPWVAVVSYSCALPPPLTPRCFLRQMLPLVSQRGQEKRGSTFGSTHRFAPSGAAQSSLHRPSSTPS
jgi:hypothetical protein